MLVLYVESAIDDVSERAAPTLWKSRQKNDLPEARPEPVTHKPHCQGQAPRRPQPTQCQGRCERYKRIQRQCCSHDKRHVFFLSTNVESDVSFFFFFLRHGLLRVFPRDVLFDQLSPQSCFSCSKSVSEARDLVTSYLPSNGIALLTHHRESASGTLMQNAHRWRWEGEMGRKDTYTPFSPDSEAVLGQHAILTGFCH